MLSKNHKMIVMVVISLGLIGPLSFIAQEAASNHSMPPAEAAPTPPPQTVKLTQVREYTATVAAEIVSVEPILIAIVESNKTAEEAELAYSNLSNASLLNIQPHGPETFTVVFSLDSPENAIDTIYELYLRPYPVLDYAMPAEIALPQSYIAMRNGVEYELQHRPTDEVQALVTGINQNGTAVFSMQITESGGKVKISAFESSA